MELTRPMREHELKRAALILGVPAYAKRLEQRVADGTVIAMKHGQSRTSPKTFRAVKKRRTRT
jgi:hypothetical protein